MPERERTAMRDPEPGSQTSYDKAMKLQSAWIDRQFMSKLVLREEDRPWEKTRQGPGKFFLYCSITPDTALQDFKVFVRDIRRHSGKHIHQGGVIIYVLEGSGWSIVDGERLDWAEGDLVILPLRPGGVEHQHFNTDPDKGCTWLAMLWYPFQNYLASELKQTEEAPVE